ncbi:MAG: hypothetical protein AMS26_15345 [Bacteroides sp. SM23_62]|nr:MAG: hypothetical protein AMS26_15345 [Bacteroides sp. SM23_62]
MNPISREFQVFVKPVGARCNLDCQYCYYLEKDALYPFSKLVLMSEKVLERYIIRHLEAATEQIIGFSWHGGEPTLAGIGFFRKAVEIQKRHQPSGTTIINGIQTNGTLLNEEWCDFLAKEKFVVGISMDGPSDMHDRFRLSKDQGSTFSRVLRGYRMLQKYRIFTEILCVVNAYNVNFPLDVYRFFKELGVHFLTFLPLVELLPGTVSTVSERSVPAGNFGVFLNTIFDEWAEKDIGTVKIQIFEEAARTAFGQDHTLCIFKKTCGGVPVIEHNGDFYSCDHYVDAAHKLGNISRNTLAQLLDHPEQKSFGQAKKETLPRYCRECEVLDMCNGECPKNRFITAPSGEAGLNYLCEGYKQFFKHCRPFVDAVSAQWNNQL